MKKRSITAAEFRAELATDSAYEETLHSRARRSQETEEGAKPILDELRLAGAEVSTISELRERYVQLPGPVVEILLRWLAQTDSVAIQETIVRSLALAADSFDVRILLNLFEKSTSDSLRWAIGNTLAELRPFDARTWIEAALSNRSFGRGREMLPLALARISSPEVANRTLRAHLDEMPGHVALAMAESGGSAELELLDQFADDQRTWVRKEVRRAITAIERRIGTR